MLNFKAPDESEIDEDEVDEVTVGEEEPLLGAPASVNWVTAGAVGPIRN